MDQTTPSTVFVVGSYELEDLVPAASQTPTPNKSQTPEPTEPNVPAPAKQEAPGLAEPKVPAPAEPEARAPQAPIPGNPAPENVDERELEGGLRVHFAPVVPAGERHGSLLAPLGERRGQPQQLPCLCQCAGEGVWFRIGDPTQLEFVRFIGVIIFANAVATAMLVVMLQFMVYLIHHSK